MSRSCALYLLAQFLAPFSAQPAGPGSSYVWPFHGSGGGAGLGGWASSEVPVGAGVPRGAMRLGPDTTTCWGGADWWWEYNHYGGYWYELEGETCVRAFSHSHAQGTGLGDGGALGMIVTRDATASIPSILDETPYRSAVSHTSEKTSPGYYSVFLNTSSTLAEVVGVDSTSGMHRYTCGGGSAAACVLVVDACHRNHINDCGPGVLSVSTDGDTVTISASFTENGSFSSDCGGVPIFFTATVTASNPSGGASLALLDAGRWADGHTQPGVGTSNSSGISNSLGLWLSWASPAVITVRISVSYVSLEKAVYNSLVNTLAFDDARTQAAAAWAAELGTIIVNDVGFTDADVAAHRAAATHSDDLYWEALHSVPGRAPSTAGAVYAQTMAEDAAAAWLRKGGEAERKRARRAGLDANATGRDILSAIRKSTAPSSPWTRPGDLPPRYLRSMPPAERLGTFYSSFYHALSAPTVYNDRDGAFAGLRGTTGNSSTWGGNYLSDFSLWDVYRSQTPLLAIVAPRVASDMLHSFTTMFNASGLPPHWVWANCETGCMPGSHGLAVWVDFIVKGVVGGDATVALAAAIAGLSRQEGTNYDTLGYVPLDESQNGASLTLDFAFDDACGALIAELAGNETQAAVWRARAQNYRNIFLKGAAAGGAAVNGAMCPRFKNESFLLPCPPLDLPPILLCPYYTEGNGLQYTFSVPHDVAGLLSLYDKPADFVSLLQQQMANTSMWPVNAFPNPWYWAGNEPDVLAPFLFSFLASDAWRTQYWVRSMLDTYYQLVPDGVPGNDDLGELNAWATWSCLGLYPLSATRNGSYILTSPCFANTTVQLPAADARFAGYAHARHATSDAVPLLTVVARNFTVANIFIRNATLNGVLLTSPIVSHADLFPPLETPRLGEDPGAHAKRIATASAAGSILEYWLTDTPLVWGTEEPVSVPDW